MKKINPFVARVRQLNNQLLGEGRFIDEKEDDGLPGDQETIDIDDDGDIEADDLADLRAGKKDSDVVDGEEVEEAVEPNKKDKPKLVDPSQTDIEKVDESDEVPDSPGVEDFEDNVDDEPDPESDLAMEHALRKMIRNEIASMMSESKKKKTR